MSVRGCRVRLRGDAGACLTSVRQQVLLNFIAAVLEHVGHVLRHLLHHAANHTKLASHPVTILYCPPKKTL